jgi:squalene-hopene/tetraprenyl-beta-curcumene cyclase
LAILCFSQANTKGKYDKVLDNAGKFIKELQWDAGEETDPNDPAYGGAGYGKHGRPDMSNTQYLLDALHELGDGDNIEAIQRALVFVSRAQNLDVGTNDTKFASLNPDGGFYYTPAAGGSSQAGTNPNGGLRSYGSMTYAGLKSMLYAGVNKDDARVKAAVAWLSQHYGLKENPGMGAAGLYYYYHTFAKALDALGSKQVEDGAGKKHEWRSELVSELAGRQRKDGSWFNKHDRWYESDPKLVTGYALLTLNYCK